MVVGVNECSSYEICVFLVDFWHFAGSRWQRNMALLKFVPSWAGFGVSLVQGSEETWRVQNWCLPGCLNFILWVSFLARVVD